MVGLTQKKKISCVGEVLPVFRTAWSPWDSAANILSFSPEMHKSENGQLLAALAPGRPGRAENREHLAYAGFFGA